MCGKEERFFKFNIQKNYQNYNISGIQGEHIICERLGSINNWCKIVGMNSGRNSAGLLITVWGIFECVIECK